jgi:hypothetical protein
MMSAMARTVQPKPTEGSKLRISMGYITLCAKRQCRLSMDQVCVPAQSATRRREAVRHGQSCVEPQRGDANTQDCEAATADTYT